MVVETSVIRHPARTMPFDELLAGLIAAKERGAVTRRYDPATGLSLWRYSNACVYDDLWETFSLMARGLVLHEDSRVVVATPFVKFFNVGERHGTIPDLPFDAFEKVDGSLIIIYHWDGKWRCTTKGALDSQQAAWAQALINKGGTESLSPGWTYLCEAIYPENVIVVRYEETGLVMLGAYDEDGVEVSWDSLSSHAERAGWRTAKTHRFTSISDMIVHAGTLPATEEGFVVRFSNGLRLKIKGAEYKRIHALISRCTPIAVWEAMMAGDDLLAIRKDLPEEFWSDFDQIKGILESRIAEIEARLSALVESTAHLSDKEVGLSLKSLDPVAAPYLFGCRKGGRAKVRESIFKSVRPTGNNLEGYEPSHAMARIDEES